MSAFPLPGVLFEPWEAIHPAYLATFEKELQGELRPEYPLKGLDCRAIAKRADRDDALFWTPLSNTAYAVVHLTWGPHPDPMEGIPSVELFTTWEDFCARRMIPDHEDWVKWSSED